MSHFYHAYTACVIIVSTPDGSAGGDQNEWRLQTDATLTHNETMPTYG